MCRVIKQAIQFAAVVVCFLAAVSARPVGDKDVATCCSDFLRSQARPFSGAVFLPGSTGFYDATHIDNRRVATARIPAIVLAPSNAWDVSLSLQCAQTCGAAFAVLSGGHSAEGYCLQENGVVLNMRAMNSTYFVDVTDLASPANASSAALYVESGARWREVYEFVSNSGSALLPVGGGCPQVGVGGFTLGGGWSFLSRSYGLGCDNVLAFTVVLANGSLVNASRSSDDSVSSELFWSMCGGGGGNFGVVTSFVIELRPSFNPALQLPPPSAKIQSPLLLVGQLCWPAFSPAVLNIMRYYLSTFSSMPRWLNLVPSWLPLGDGHSVVFCVTVVCNNGQEPCQSFVTPLLKAALSPPQLNTVSFQSYLGWEAAHSNVTDAQEGYLYLTSGIISSDALTLNMTADLEQLLQQAPSPRNLILLHVGGGAIGDVASNATAFPYRNTQFVVQAKAIWSNSSSTAAAANIQWVRKVRQYLLGHISGSYINYIDKEFPDWQTAYYSTNYERLQRLKAMVDPTNFFHFAQSIELPARQ